MAQRSRRSVRVVRAADSAGMDRRQFLTALGTAGATAAVVSACAPAGAPDWPPVPPGTPEPGVFPEGVMAGDPRPGGSTIWTRVLPGPEAGPLGEVAVVWSVAADASFDSILVGGATTAVAATGHGVTVPVDGLPEDAWLHYRFECRGEVSRTGRLRTAPATGSSPDRLRIAFASCQQLSSQFVAHRAIAAEPDLDMFMHLGDYVYVSDTDTLTRQQYRDCYSRWRGQPLLRDLHATVPTVAMWDDGEFYNGVDSFGDPDRLAAAKDAWFDSFPLVDPGGRRTHRSLAWGDLADIPMIDVRAYRDPAIDDLVHVDPGGPDDPTRTTLGAEQYAWLTDLLAASTASWRVVGNPYNIAPFKLVNLDWLANFRPDTPPGAAIYAPNEAWDDYLRERRDLLSFLADHSIDDTVFASAHTHMFITSELHIDDRPGTPPAAIDFCTGSLTADPDVRTAYLEDLPLDVAEEVLGVAEAWVVANNQPGMRHFNIVEQGYTVLDITPEEMVVTHRLIDTHDPAATARDGARFRVVRGTNRIEVLPVPGASGTFG